MAHASIEWTLRNGVTYASGLMTSIGTSGTSCYLLALRTPYVMFIGENNMTNPLPNWNARKIREASVPLKGKPLRNTKSYVKALAIKEHIPTTVMGSAFLKAIMA